MDLQHFILNTAAAIGMGMLIGLERQFGQHPAGLRTNVLVCLGAALFVSVPAFIEHESSPTHIAAQVVSGIGFLGGGVILREGVNIRGLNTAATLWCSAAVGVLSGFGLLAEAAFATTAILIVNLVLRPLVRVIDSRFKATAEIETHYRFRAVCGRKQERVVRTVLMRHVNSHPTMMLQGVSTSGESEGGAVVVVEIQSAKRDDKFMEDLVSRIGIEPGVTSASWENVL